MKPVTFIKKHAHLQGKHLQLNDDILEAIAKQKMPFTAKNYYAFCDKHLEDDVNDALYHDGEEKYFREIATDYDTLRYLNYLRGLFEYKPVFCDIGCGIGNVVHYAGKMDYHTFGYEVNSSLAPLHRKIKADVAYGDILKISLERLRTADAIYLFRPINDTKMMNRLFALIHKQAKKTAVIIYNYPHTRSIRGYTTVCLGHFDDVILLLKN